MVCFIADVLYPDYLFVSLEDDDNEQWIEVASDDVPPRYIAF